MAWPQSLSLSSSLPFSNHISTCSGRKIRSSLSTSFPSKRNNIKKRNNYLRQKLLKTLTKPNHPLQIPQNDDLQNLPKEIPTSFSEQNEENQQQKEENQQQKEEEEQQDEEEEQQQHQQMVFNSTEIPKTLDFDARKEFINLAFSFLGLFIFQTVCAVWVLGSADSAGNSNAEVQMVDKVKNGDMGFHSGESEFEKKVSEIQVLAREARVIERRKSGNSRSVSSPSNLDNGDGVIVETATSRIRSDIQKGVERRLLKLQKSIRSRSERSPKSLSSDAEVGNLPFRKKPALRFSSMKARNEPKGFGGSKNKKNSSLDQEEQNGDATDGNSLEEKEELHWLSDETLKGIILKAQANEQAGREPFIGFGSVEEMNFFRALVRKFEREGENAKEWVEKKLRSIDLSNGSTRKVSHEKSKESVRPDQMTESVVQGNISDVIGKLVERSESEHSTSVSSVENGNRYQKNFRNDPSTEENSLHDKSYFSQSSIGAGKQKKGSLTEIKSREFLHSEHVNQGTSSAHGKQIRSSKNGSSNSQLGARRVKQSVLHKVKDGKSNLENDLWWLDLPYVLAIILCRGSDGEGPRGFYSLKVNSELGSGNSSSYTIAFEDRVDATNFCYLLESFFEDLGDFSADVVPLSIKELEERVKSKGVKVIVVRKGQLQLYAGQPLEDVEASLRLILERK